MKIAVLVLVASAVAHLYGFTRGFRTAVRIDKRSKLRQNQFEQANERSRK